MQPNISWFPRIAIPWFHRAPAKRQPPGARRYPPLSARRQARAGIRRPPERKHTYIFAYIYTYTYAHTCVHNIWICTWAILICSLPQRESGTYWGVWGAEPPRKSRLSLSLSLSLSIYISLWGRLMSFWGCLEVIPGLFWTCLDGFLDWFGWVFKANMGIPECRVSKWKWRRSHIFVFLV